VVLQQPVPSTIKRHQCPYCQIPVMKHSQALARGKNATAAHEEAGYKPNRSTACQLKQIHAFPREQLNCRKLADERYER